MQPMQVMFGPMQAMLVSGLPAGATNGVVGRKPGRVPVLVEPDARRTAPVNLRRMRCASAHAKVCASCVGDAEVAVHVGRPLSGASEVGPAVRIG